MECSQQEENRRDVRVALQRKNVEWRKANFMNDKEAIDVQDNHQEDG